MQHFPFRIQVSSNKPRAYFRFSFICLHFKRKFHWFSHYVHCVQVVILLSRHFSERKKNSIFPDILRSLFSYFNLSLFLCTHHHDHTWHCLSNYIFWLYIHVQLIEKILSNHIIMNWCDKHLYFSFRYLYMLLCPYTYP